MPRGVASRSSSAGDSANVTVAADDRLTATFADGSTAVGDLLIGADGHPLRDPADHRSRGTERSLRRPENFGGVTGDVRLDANVRRGA